MQTDMFSLPITTAEGNVTTLASWQSKVLLIVNVASKCGLTPQYEKLEMLHRRWQAQGFSVLGFPCNQFLGQEPGSDADIQTWCKTTWDVTFPVLSKIEVNGAHRHPLYQALITAAPVASAPAKRGVFVSMMAKLRLLGRPDDILWNFEKFLINRQGHVIGRFSPDTPPDDPALVRAIEQALEA